MLGKWFPQFRRIVVPSSSGSVSPRRVLIRQLDRRRYKTSKSESLFNKFRWAGRVRPVGEKRNACRNLVRNPEGKRPLQIPGRKREDNIKMALKEIGWEGVHWVRLAQWLALVNTVMNLRVP
jgi:hypothetical protein